MTLVTIDVSRVSTSLYWIQWDTAISLFCYCQIVKKVNPPKSSPFFTDTAIFPCLLLARENSSLGEKKGYFFFSGKK